MCISGWRLAAVVVSGTMIGPGWAGEEKVPLEKLPPAVKAAVQKRFPGVELLKAGKEVEDGKTTYEVSIKSEGHKIDIDVTPEGAIVEMEKEIDVASLPKAVSGALDAKYRGATLLKAEEIIKVNGGKETLQNYEVLLQTAEKKRYEVVLSAEGKIEKEEAKNAPRKGSKQSQ